MVILYGLKGVAVARGVEGCAHGQGYDLGIRFTIAHTHTHTCARTHAHTHARTHTHTHTQMHSSKVYLFATSCNMFIGDHKSFGISFINL